MYDTPLLSSIQLKNDHKGLVASVVLPGLDFGSINKRTKFMSLFSMSNNFELARMQSMQAANFIEIGKMLKENNLLQFLIAGQYYFSPGFFIPFPRNIEQPVLYQHRVHHLGKSSYSLSGLCKLPNSDESIAEIVCSVVTVDKYTRKSSPLPDWFRTRFHDNTKVPHPTTLNPLKSIPAEAFCHDLTVRPSDTDENGHTNQAVYIKYCSNTKYLAATSNLLPPNYIDNDHKVKVIDTLYTRESSTGDKLKCYVWQGKPMVLHFQVHKDSEPIFHANMEFDGTVTSNL
ncbi:uncharacterized protein LOC106176879 isoform X2 [Lingula anatina]|nr:uncharacterized protein LOC106176879 isoform X2 [Lingula anatina]|eukprot:XP_013414900.1 uncharacterized protein LOC106176879 isoform X2 [Lingula anatina]